MDIFAEQLGKSARDLEMAAKHSDFDFIENNNSAFLQMAWKLIDDIENMLAVIEAENPKPKKKKPDAELLSKLLVACQKF